MRGRDQARETIDENGESKVRASRRIRARASERERLVSRSFAEWCGVFDLLGAVGILAAAIL
jgi:hypothetical protein